MEHNFIYFIHGLCCMFYSMMAWLFWRNRQSRLSKFVMALMLLIAVQSIKDVFFLSDKLYGSSQLWTAVTSVDMIAVPFYAFILMELCNPGMTSARLIAIEIAPFVVLPVLYLSTGIEAFYDIEVAWAAIFGLSYAIWTIFAIRRYNSRPKQQFSYVENINLDWLRIILVFFFAILSLWIVGCRYINIDAESVYLLGSLIMWMFLCYFIYRHKSVISELKASVPEETSIQSPPSDSTPDMSKKILRLFDEQQIYLNPNLKLSDIASVVGSNRTYVSRFFNAEQNSTFFDFVNGYRVRMATSLLRETDEKIEVIAERVGFNSSQAFHRVFSKTIGQTPEKFRSGNRSNSVSAR